MSDLPRHSLVIVNLINPKEKFWGVLESLSMVGLTMRAINLDTFDDWVRQVARKSEDAIDLVTMFVPLFRVERIFLDEPVGAVRAYHEHFTAVVGTSARSYLGIEES